MVRIDPERYPPEIHRQIDYPLSKRPIHEYLRHYADEDPDRVAITFYGREVTYGDLDDASDRLATYLSEEGFEAGDALLLYLPNTPQFFVGYYATQKLGVMASPCSPMAKTHRLRYQANDGDAKGILALDSKADLVEEVRDDTDLETIVYTRFEKFLPDNPLPNVPESMQDAVAAPELDDATYLRDILNVTAADPPTALDDFDRTVVLQYTGGTTGMPKGCEHTYRTICNGAARYATLMLYEEDDRHLCYLPVFHIAGKTSVVDAPFLHGGSVVLLARADPEAVMTAVDAYGPTQCYMAAKTANEILRHPDRNDYELTSFTTNPVSGFSESVTPQLCRRWYDATEADMFECSYGLTESHKALTFTHKIGLTEPGFVGYPAHDVDVEVRDWDTHDPLPAGERGEITVQCSSMMAGYYGKLEATEDAFHDGYLLTGDYGKLTDEGFLYYLGRHKNLIKSSGFSVAPKEVEAILESREGVENSVVMGRGEGNDQTIVAFISLTDPSIIEADLHNWCEEDMAAYKRPDEIHVLESFPETDVGKIDRKRLTEKFS